MKKKKTKGVVLLEAFLALMLMAMASYGLAAVNSVQFSQLVASADANQAKNYAELEAQYLKQLGYDDVVDENYDDDEPSRTPRYPSGKNSSDDKASNARNMTKFLGNTEGAKWKSTATLGETITNIGGDPDNKIQNVVVSVYKASDGTSASPRATITVPLSTQGNIKGVTPVGGVIIWPKDSDPNTSSIVWLECNGQSYDTNKYKKLYKALGSNKVPNFQGMFLRGSGSQSFTQFNGYKKGNSSTTYSSGSVGEIQGDAIRLLRGFADGYFLSFDLHSNGMTSYPVSSSWYYKNSGIDGDCWINAGASPWGAHIGNLQNMKFPFNPKHYKYRLEGSGGEYADYSLSEYTSPPDSDEAISVKASLADIGFSSDIVAPYDNEIRPVNMAVKYYIRAK